MLAAAISWDGSNTHHAVTITENLTIKGQCDPIRTLCFDQRAVKFVAVLGQTLRCIALIELTTFLSIPN
jgi:hypothetical protein